MRTPTPGQLAALRRDRHVAAVANAGSGKTFALVARYTRFVLEGRRLSLGDPRRHLYRRGRRRDEATSGGGAGRPPRLRRPLGRRSRLGRTRRARRRAHPNHTRLLPEPSSRVRPRSRRRSECESVGGGGGERVETRSREGRGRRANKQGRRGRQAVGASLRIRRPVGARAREGVGRADWRFTSSDSSGTTGAWRISRER